jgi:surface carbohydrate biosynthesis protein
MDMGSATLILPIEIKIRELYGKALLAAYAAEAGMDVILGDQRIISRSLHRLPAGIYLDKSIATINAPQFTRLKNLGFRCAAWCEEGLVYRNKRAYQHERVYAPALQLLDVFFAWGDVQRDDILEVVPQARDKIHVFGNPRFDLLRPGLRDTFKQDVQDLHARFGRYILVNTNFSRFNRFPGRDDVQDVLKKRGITLSDEQKDYYENWVNHLGEVFAAFAKAVPLVVKAFPDHRIVLRPHPSENHERWRDELKGVSNVTVISEGNAIPWMMGAEAVIHNACTTGVESFLLDRPTISYVPVVHEIFNRLNYLPNAVSRSVQTEDQLISQVAKILAGNHGDPEGEEKRAMVQRYVGDLSGPLATESIVRILRQLTDGESKDEPRSLRRTQLRLLSAARAAAARARRALRPDKSLSAYMEQKFPELGIDELRDVLAKIGRARGKPFAIELLQHPQLATCFVLRQDRQTAGRNFAEARVYEPA